MRKIFLLLTLIIISIPAIHARGRAPDMYQRIIEDVSKKRYLEAYELANKSGKIELKKFVLSQKYKDSSSDASFEEVISFIKKYPDWPEIEEMKRSAEEKISMSTNFEAVLNWFAKNPPKTGNGHKYYAYAIISKFNKLSKPTESDVAKKNKAIKKGWVYGSFCKKDQQEYLNKYKNILSANDHIEKVNNLLWKNNIDKAQELLHLVDPASKRMFLARIAAMNKSNATEGLFRAVPETHKYNSGLLFAYLRYRLGQSHDIDITSLMLKAPRDLENSGEWWKIKNLYIRELLKRQDYKNAYLIARNHHSIQSVDASEGHWMAGWIAQSFLKDYHAAEVHLKHFYSKVGFPISLSRGAFWLGQSYEKQQKLEEAKIWYAKAAAFPETYYGQLATKKLGKDHISLPPQPKVTAAHMASVRENQIIKVGQILAKYNKQNLAKTYIETAIIKSKNPAEVMALIHEAERKRNYFAMVDVAKFAQRHKILVAKQNYPMPYIVPKDSVEPALAHSIIRQESVFDHRAVSSANAYGLMQLIIPTAQEMCKSLKMKYMHHKLARDPHYNVYLGSHYLRQLVDEFNGSYILAIAAYNGGIGNVRKWIKANGDPREFKTHEEIVNWIELIPFAETRNYVQRVLENLQVYRSIFVADKKLKITDDLKRKYKPGALQAKN